MRHDRRSETVPCDGRTNRRDSADGRGTRRARRSRPRDPEPLKMWTRSGTDARAAWDALTAKFTEQTGIKVELFSATTDFEQRLARALASGELPDVIINDTSSLGQFVALGVASEIDRGTSQVGRRHQRSRVAGCARVRRQVLCGAVLGASVRAVHPAATGAPSSACRCRRPGPICRRCRRRSPKRTPTATARRTPTGSSSWAP